MKNLFYSISIFAIVALSTACNEGTREGGQNTETDADKSTVTFLEKGIKGGLAETIAANLAINKRGNAKVVALASMILADHNSIEKELQKLADDKDVVIDNTLSTEHQGMIRQLQSIKGAEFDSTYVDMMVMEHKKDVKLFENELHNKDGDVQKVAEGALPKLKKHLQTAQEIQASLK